MLLAKAGTEGSISVKLTWERVEKPVLVIPPATAPRPFTPPTTPTAAGHADKL